MHGKPASNVARAAIARFEQLTAPVAAKSVEDTAFYRYPRLLSRNEVGAHPAVIHISVEKFHAACMHRQQHWPAAMLCTASHDHKLGEDARMRLATLSQCPRRWASRARDWIAHWGHFDREGPDGRDLYMMLQMLVAIWPPDLRPDAHADMQALSGRMQGWLTKALRESGRHGDWTCPNEAYEAAASRCLDAMFDDAPFLAEVCRYVDSLASASALSSIAQLTLRCTTPGIPDLYQGREFWDFSMVDPDNRRGIDFAVRAASFVSNARIDTLVHSWRNGHIKRAWLARLLQARKQYPDLFACGSHIPLHVRGMHAEHVIAFARRHRNRCMLVVVPRCPLPLLGRRTIPLIVPRRWHNTVVVLPESMCRNDFRGLASGQALSVKNNVLALSELLKGVPAEVLMTPASASSTEKITQ